MITIRTSHSFTRVKPPMILTSGTDRPSLTNERVQPPSKADAYIKQLNTAFETRAVVGILREV